MSSTIRREWYEGQESLVTVVKLVLRLLNPPEAAASYELTI